MLTTVLCNNQLYVFNKVFHIASITKGNWFYHGICGVSCICARVREVVDVLRTKVDEIVDALDMIFPKGNPQWMVCVIRDVKNSIDKVAKDGLPFLSCERWHQWWGSKWVKGPKKKKVVADAYENGQTQ